MQHVGGVLGGMPRRGRTSLQRSAWHLPWDNTSGILVVCHHKWTTLQGVNNHATATTSPNPSQ